MIVYSPINGEVLTSAINYNPRHAFLMTQLGGDISEELNTIRLSLETLLKKSKISLIDASSFVTGGDFLLKIWNILLGVPIGFVILNEKIPSRTIANIYYELGMMDALGKETLIIKSRSYKIPSDFIRTEYVNYDDDFEINLLKFLDNLKEREKHYSTMAELMQADPVLSIDYIRRAFLLNPNKSYVERAASIFDLHEDQIDDQSKFHIKNFLNYQK